MHMFENPRKVVPPAKYQFHFELTEDDVKKLEKELNTVPGYMPPKTRHVIEMLMRGVQATHTEESISQIRDKVHQKKADQVSVLTGKVRELKRLDYSISTIAHNLDIPESTVLFLL